MIRDQPHSPVSHEAPEPDSGPRPAAVAMDILDAGDRLEGFARRSEPDFLAMCEALENIHNSAMQLKQHGVDILQTLGGVSDQGPLADVERFSLEAVSDLQRFKGVIADHQSRVDSMSDEIEILGQKGETVERIGKELRMIAMCINLETERLAVDRSFFTSFVEDIRQFADELCEVGRDISDSIESALETQREAYRELYAGRAELVRLADRTGTLVNQAVDDTRELMKGVLRAFEKAEEHSGNLSGQTGKLVVAMQFHDSMSQRIDHVCRALSDLAARLLEQDPGDAGEGQWSGAHSILGLQTAQMRKVAEETRDVHRSMDEGFDGLISESGKMAESLTRLEQDTRGRTSGADGDADPLSRLTGNLTECHVLLDESAGLMTRLLERAESVLRVTERLGGHLENVQEASHRLRILALNANIGAGKAGSQGRALLILATEVNNLSQRSHGFADDMMEVLTAVERSARHMRKRASESVAEKEDLETRRNMMLDGVEKIAGARDMLRAYSKEAAEDLGKMRDRVVTMRGELRFMPRLAAEMQGCLEDMEEVSGRMGPWAERETWSDHEDIRALRRRYTVREEHDIHSEYMASREVFPGEGSPGAEAGDGGDEPEFGDNVELF
ncbi:MAG: methyl-accepting chemotaxis protein [Desulfatibacillaceae bacterium]